MTTEIISADLDKVIDGINSLISMFEIVGQSAFPRKIMTADYPGAFTVHDIGQLFNAFERAKFKDCRISAYPLLQTEEELLIPNISMLDLDYDDNLVNMNGKEYADRVLKTKINKILKNLQINYNIRNFMVMYTGNGRHVIIPFMFNIPLEHIEELSIYLPFISKYQRNPNNCISQEFLVFAKRYFSNDQADLGNYPNFKSIFLRVPGTLNMKQKYENTAKIVKIEHELSYEENTIPNFGDLYPNTNVFYDFMHHLAITAGDCLTRKMSYRNGSKTRYNNSWIEVLWNSAISDCRKRIIWLILPRYAINVKKMSHDTAFSWIKQWVDRCDLVEKLDTNYDVDVQINYYLDEAENTGYFPPKFETLKNWRWKMMDGTDLYDLIKSKMSQY